ncbi:MAG: hypothetical protein HY314_06785 [Acidobacteria bacterium]|nr:hypothetical protein [Acidobacteriota bacterium]
MVDADRVFFKINSVFCLFVGLNLVGKAVGQWRSGLTADVAYQDLDKYMDLILRHFAQQSFYFAVFAGYIPAMMLISLVVSFYLYLHERSRSVSLIAFVFGTAMGAVWISRRLFGMAMTVVALKYMNATSAAAKQDLFAQVKSLYYYDSLGNVLSGQTSLIAYALFGFLFLRGKGLEYAVGALFLGSSVTLLVFQIITPSSWFVEAAGVLVLPAIAFILSSVLLWQYKPSVEVWAQEVPRPFDPDEDETVADNPAPITIEARDS